MTQCVLKLICDSPLEPTSNLANIYLFKVNNKNIKKRSEICSNLTIKASEQRH